MSDFEPPGGPPPPPPSEEPPQPGWWKASDGNWYPPEQAPQQPAPPQPAPPQTAAQQGQPPVPPPPSGQGYGQGPQGYQPYTGGTPTNGVATWSLVLGIASIVLFWTFGFGILLGIVAIVLGVMGGNKAKQLPGSLNAGRAKAGLVTGILGCIGGVLFFGFLLTFADEVIDDVRDEVDRIEREQELEGN